MKQEFKNGGWDQAWVKKLILPEFVEEPLIKGC